MSEEFQRMTSLERMNREEALGLILEASEIFEREPPLIRIDSEKVVFVGDTHGDLLTSLSVTKQYLDDGWHTIFLGDYVDRGRYQIANIHFLLEQKKKEAEHLILLRGNHETRESNFFYGFYQRVKSTYGTDFYSNYEKLFSKLSHSALVNDEFIAVHGGLARDLHSISDLEQLPKGQTTPRGMLFELLWNDPNEAIEGFEPNERGPGTFYFGTDALSNFLKRTNLEAMIRSHEPRQKGYSIEMNKKLYTVFSCRFYGISPAALELVKGNLTPVLV